MIEYREDDDNRGYCPICGEPLSNITVAGSGYCEQHGWQFADWKPAIDDEEDGSSD